MNKKEYQKPAMRVVKIQHTGMLMTSEKVTGQRTSYGTANDGVTGDINSDGEWEWN